MLTRPILSTTVAFDAKRQKTFLFSVQGTGSQVVANQLTIRDQQTNQIVYQNIQNTFKYEHILPENTLINGRYYNATVTILDAKGERSAPSLAIQFSCYTTPNIKFNNIPANRIINNSSFDFSFTYEQSEGERLNSYIVNLYNASQIMISTSKLIYVQDGTPPYTGSYLFAGFEDNTVYYIEIICETVEGMSVQTPREQIEINYVRPSLFTLMELKNNCEEGYVSVTSNITLVSGSYYPDPPVFINNKEIDLTNSSRDYIEWNQGYTINNDFLVRAWFRAPRWWTTIIQFSNTAGQVIKVKFALGYEDVDAAYRKGYVQVYVESVEGQEYYIYSNYVDLLPNEEYYNLQLRRENGLYQVALLEA